MFLSFGLCLLCVYRLCYLMFGGLILVRLLAFLVWVFSDFCWVWKCVLLVCLVVFVFGLV